MRKIPSLLTIFLWLLASIAPGTAFPQPQQLRFAVAENSGTEWRDGVLEYVDAVNTNEVLRDLVHLSAVPIPYQEIISAIQKNRVQLALLNTQLIEQESAKIGAQPTVVFNYPFTIPTIENAIQVQRGIAGETALAAFADAGLLGLAYWNKTPSHLISKKPILAFTDLKGMKIKTVNLPSSTSFLKSSSATEVPLAYSDVYLALQTGIVDAIEVPSDYSAKAFETAKFYLDTNSVVSG